MTKPTASLKSLTRVNGQVGELLLYGYIGQTDWEKPDLDLTSQNIISAITELEDAGVNRINVRINSPGGNVFEGAAIINALRSSKASIHTYVDGVAASMAAVIWATGEKKHMAGNASLMFHAASTMAWGNAARMRKTAEDLEHFDSNLIADLATAIKKDKEEIKSSLFDGEDHWMNLDAARAYGFEIEEDDDDEDEDDTIMDALTRSTNVIQAHAAEMVQIAQRQMRSIQTSYERMRIAALATNISLKITNVTQTELAAALADGKLTVEEVQATLASHTPEADPAPVAADPAPVADPDPVVEPVAPVAAPAPSPTDTLLANLQATITNLQQEINDLKGSQGGTPSRLPNASTSTPSAAADSSEYSATMALRDQLKDHTQKFH